MNIGVLGTGMVGDAIASKLVALGHEVTSPVAGYVNGAVVRVDGGSHTWAG
jgi:3-hydroxyisobutyrate dehydrogenase-like beta-hydroxyacid dehydrogenase